MNCDLVIRRIPGMTALGLMNAESRTHSRNHIISAFRKCHNGQTEIMFVQIGQVDVCLIVCRFVQCLVETIR